MSGRGVLVKYLVRPMVTQDISQVSEIEREVFPTQWPPTVYKRELQNKLAHYLVAVEPPEPGHSTSVSEQAGESVPVTVKTRYKRWLSRIKAFIKREPLANQEEDVKPPEPVIGAIGFWLILDEAHITTIGVRKTYQRQGIGELLLIKAIELAKELGAQVITLEVRISNTVPQALYEKYGFQRVGSRRAYYSDNKEDALIMTTDHITSASYQAKFQLLKEEHSQRWN